MDNTEKKKDINQRSKQMRKPSFLNEVIFLCSFLSELFIISPVVVTIPHIWFLIYLYTLREGPPQDHPSAHRDSQGIFFNFRFLYLKRKVISNHSQIQNIRPFRFVYEKCGLKHWIGWVWVKDEKDSLIHSPSFYHCFCHILKEINS
jgi:hypothetical protein